MKNSELLIMALVGVGGYFVYKQYAAKQAAAQAATQAALVNPLTAPSYLTPGTPSYNQWLISQPIG